MIYLIIFLGWLLGELLVIVVQSIRVQNSSKYSDNFWKAFVVYTTKDIGPIVGSLLICLIAIFLLPEAIANFSTMDETGNQEEKKQSAVIHKILKFLRASSVLLGITSRTLLFLIVSKANKWLNKVGGSDAPEPPANLTGSEEKPKP